MKKIFAISLISVSLYADGSVIPVGAAYASDSSSSSSNLSSSSWNLDEGVKGFKSATFSPFYSLKERSVAVSSETSAMNSSNVLDMGTKYIFSTQLPSGYGYLFIPRGTTTIACNSNEAVNSKVYSILSSTPNISGEKIEYGETFNYELVKNKPDTYKFLLDTLLTKQNSYYMLSNQSANIALLFSNISKEFYLDLDKKKGRKVNGFYLFMSKEVEGSTSQTPCTIQIDKEVMGDWKTYLDSLNYDWSGVDTSGPYSKMQNRTGNPVTTDGFVYDINSPTPSPTPEPTPTSSDSKFSPILSKVNSQAQAWKLIGFSELNTNVQELKSNLNVSTVWFYDGEWKSDGDISNYSGVWVK